MLSPRRVALLTLLLALHACTVGSARSFDTRRDLSGLDLAYLRGEVAAQHDENSQRVDGKLTGFPFWFLPAAMHVELSSSLHRGDVVEPVDESEVATSPISGFEYTDMHALAFGLLTYKGNEATWGADGELMEWRRDVSLGAGLLYRSHQRGDGDKPDVFRVHLLAGMFGYSEAAGEGYLSVLWIPIPVRW